jgi:hypothetical protein
MIRELEREVIIEPRSLRKLSTKGNKIKTSETMRPMRIEGEE